MQYVCKTSNKCAKIEFFMQLYIESKKAYTQNGSYPSCRPQHVKNLNWWTSWLMYKQTIMRFIAIYKKDIQHIFSVFEAIVLLVWRE